MSPRTHPRALACLLRSSLATGLIVFASLCFANSASASFSADSFGISAGGALQNEDPATLGRDLDAMKAAGSKWLRVDINWAQIQSAGQTSYAWDSIDRVVQGASARGIRVLGVIMYTPSWARPAGTSATYGPDPATYAAFAAVAAQHYAALGVHAFEVWNEPNTKSFWTPAPNIAAYTRLLKAAYPAIKAADPQATVLSGGTAPAPSDGTNYLPQDFLAGIYANGGGGSFDAVSHHPYCWPAYPGDAESWSAWYQMYGTAGNLRSIMVNNGDGGKQIWGTEFGAPTNGPSGSHVTEAVQASMITKAYAEWSTYSWAGPLFAYQGRDLGTDTGTRENFFGLLRNDFSPKPAYTAYQVAAAAVGGATQPTTTVPDSPTTVVVKGKGKGKGNVSGRVALRRSAAASKPTFTSKVKLKLFRKLRGHWRSASGSRRTALSSHGRFRARLGALNRRLQPGAYRVRAKYPGSRGLKPSSSLSRRFEVRT